MQNYYEGSMCLVLGRNSIKGIEIVAGIVVIIIRELSLIMMKGLNTREVCLVQKKKVQEKGSWSSNVNSPTFRFFMLSYFNSFTLTKTHTSLPLLQSPSSFRGWHRWPKKESQSMWVAGFSLLVNVWEPNDLYSRGKINFLCSKEF